jgi:hypothetical protein
MKKSVMILACRKPKSVFFIIKNRTKLFSGQISAEFIPEQDI